MYLNRRTLLGSTAGTVLALAAAKAGIAQDEETFHGVWAEGEVSVTLRTATKAPILRYVVERLPEGEKGPSVEGACFTHPIVTPNGEVVSDMAPADHPHHRGVFCGWVQVEGELEGDWWGWGAKAPKEGRFILSREARITEHSAERVTLRLINSWRAGEETVLGERLTLSATAAPGWYVLDYDYKFTVPTRKSVRIVENPFGGFCYRARPRGKLEVTGPDGVVNLPDSVHNKAETNWPSSHWYDLTYRTPDGKATGVAVMDHPNNPLSTWHGVRGIHMLNPCIVAQGSHEIEFGDPLYLKYRLVAHDGDASSVDLLRLYKQFSGDE